MAVVLWLGHRRAARIEYVSGLGTEDRRISQESPTGYVGGWRWLIAPEHANETYQTVLETQQLLATGEPRIRRVDFDSPPVGRGVHRTSVLHWCMGVAGWIDHTLTGRPLGVSVERAAVHGPIVLHLLLLVSAVVFAAAQFGGLAAALLALGIIGLFPWAGNFLPGAPHLHGLALVGVVWSLLPLTAALAGRHGDVGPPVSRAPWIAAGVAGGLGLWANVPAVAPALAGLVLGAAVAPWLGRGQNGPPPTSETRWRLWALAGATTSFAAYLVDFFPDRLDFRLDANHPLFAVAWVAAGELLVLSERGAQVGWTAFPTRTRQRMWIVAGVVGWVAIAFVWSGTTWFPAGSLFNSRLSDLPASPAAANLIRWMVREGLGGAVLATFLPLAAFIGTAWLVLRRGTPFPLRSASAAVLGAAGAIAVLACRELRMWSVVDGILLASVPLLTQAFAGRRARPAVRWVCVMAFVATLVPGSIRLISSLRAPAADLTTIEAESLTERNLAHWLANRVGPGRAVVLAPPFRSTGFCFHGGFRALGSTDPENGLGLTGAVRLARESSPETVRSLIEEHGITHVILPSWDETLVEFARPNPDTSEITFVAALNDWSVPLWLRPVAYQPPAIEGAVNRNVVIFEVVEDQDPATSISQVVEYFSDMEQWPRAGSAAESLRQYSADLGALVAMAQLELVQRSPRADEHVKAIVAILDSGYDQALAWDRRVSLASVLAQVRQTAHARAQLQRCLAEMDEPRLRSLSTNQLYRVHVLSRRFGLGFPNDTVRALALQLLPPGPRARVMGGAD